MLHFDARVVFSKPRSGYCTITATIPLWPPSALRRTRLESTGLGIVWPWLPYPIIPSNRTGLSNHHGSVYSFLPKALTHTVPSAWNSLPTLLPHIGSFLLIFFFSLELIVLNFSLLLQLQSRPKHLSVSGSLSSQNRLCSWGAACTLGSSFTSTPEFPSGSLRCRIPPLPASHDFLFLGFLAARWSPPPRSFLRKGRGCRF